MIIDQISIIVTVLVPGIGIMNGSPKFGDVRLFRGIFLQLRVFVLIAHIVANTQEFL